MINTAFMTVPIEDTIVAYFDGRLNDAEGAELLHRVSVSPEIRQLFQEHESLRQIAHRAARNVAVSPSLEESLFQRIAGVDRERMIPPVFWTARRISTAAGVAAILLAAIVGTFEFRSNGVGNESVSAASASMTNQPSVSQTNSSAGPATISVDAGSKILRLAKNFSDNSSTTNDRSIGNNESAGNEFAANISAAEEEPSTEPTIELHPVSRSAPVAHITLPGSTPTTLEELRDQMGFHPSSNFEIGASMPISGFDGPAVVPTEPLFSVFSVHAAYDFDANDQLALKLTGGNFTGISQIITSGGGFTSVNGKFQTQLGYAAELFYERREPVDHGMFFFTGGIGGGFYSLGTILSAEAGIEVPVGDRWLGGVSLVISRLHQNISQQSTNQPVIFDGYNIYSSLAGRIEYGMTYEF